MADKKEKRPQYTAPAGIASWPKLNTPDEKYGNYGTGVLYDPAKKVNQDFFKFLDAQHAAAVKEMKAANPKYAAKMVINPPYENETDKEGNETGLVLVKFTLPSEITRKSDGKTWKLKPRLFDSMGTPTDVEVGGGSLIKVAYELNSYFIAGTKAVGIKKSCVAVQILQLKQWSGSSQDASAFGFEAEEGFAVAGDAADDDKDAGSDEF